MKISKVSKLTLRNIFICSAAAFAAMLALRFYQLFSITDPDTGFFTDHSNFTVPVFYVFAVVFVIGLYILCFLCSDIPENSLGEKKSVVHGVLTLLFSGALLHSGTVGVLTVFDTYKVYGSFKAVGSAMGGALYAVTPFLALLAGVILLIDAIAFITGKMFIKKLKICQVFPVLWAFSVTVEYFSITASYLKMTQLMLTIFSSAFLMLFLFNYARFISGIGFDKNGASFFATGFISAFLLLVTSIPNLWFKLFAPEKTVVYCPFVLYNFFAGLFVVSAVIYVMRNRKAGVFNEESAVGGSEKTAE